MLYLKSFVLTTSLRAADDGTHSMVVSAVTMSVCRIGPSWVLCVQLGWGVIGVWVTMVGDWACRAILYTSGKWIAKSNLT